MISLANTPAPSAGRVHAFTTTGTVDRVVRDDTGVGFALLATPDQSEDCAVRRADAFGQAFTARSQAKSNLFHSVFQLPPADQDAVVPFRHQLATLASDDRMITIADPPFAFLCHFADGALGRHIEMQNFVGTGCDGHLTRRGRRRAGKIGGCGIELPPTREIGVIGESQCGASHQGKKEIWNGSAHPHTSEAAHGLPT